MPLERGASRGRPLIDAAHESDDSKGNQRIRQACAAGFQKYITQFGPDIVSGSAKDHGLCGGLCAR
jgi:hypothetical protein